MPEVSEATREPQAGRETGAPVLVFREVSKIFPDGTSAFVGVSLRLGPGELVSIVGPSGCGKTTVLKIAAGLLRPTTGTLDRADGSLGYVFQDPTLLPWRTVRRNAELLLELEGVDRAERRRRAMEALGLVGLQEFAGHLPRQLSGGMRMRASLARWLATKPELFLFDEPFGSLDEMTRERLNEDLSVLFARERFAGLFVTHSIFEAVFLSTRVIVMSPRPGRILAEFEVPFDHPRGNEVRFDPEFTALANRVSRALRGGVR
jgi:NitT/TauT family transport system ATP-binding protein